MQNDLQSHLMVFVAGHFDIRTTSFIYDKVRSFPKKDGTQEEEEDEDDAFTNNVDNHEDKDA